MESRQFPRRTLLWRGLLAVGGALGLVAAERRPRADAVAATVPQRTYAPPATSTLRLYARGWRPQVEPTAPGRSVAADHVVAYADLLATPDGAVLGRACSNGFCPTTSLGHAGTAAPTIEFQTLTLRGGSIFGIGAAALHAGAEQSYAIVGGTGEFSGVRGTYTARTTSGDLESDPTLQFTLTLTT